MYTVTFARAARKELETLPAALQARIMDKIELLADNPYPHGCKKIKGTMHAFRIRIGDYRVLYEIDDKGKIVDIAVIDHRRSVYK